MKKLLLALLLTLTVFFTGCTREESLKQEEFELTSAEFYDKVEKSFQYGSYYKTHVIVKFPETNPDLETIKNACYDFRLPLKITLDFSACSELTEIPAEWFKNSLYYTDFNFVFPESLETINDYAFYGLSATRNNPIPNNVKNLGKCCYPNNNKYITKIVIPASVNSIPESLFDVYFNIESVIFPEDSKITEIPANTFYFCSNLKSITLPPSVTKIGDRAFSQCTELRNINLPDTITTFGEWAFSYCNFKSLRIPANLETIERNMFAGTDIGTLTIPGTIKKLESAVFSSTYVDNVILEEGIEWLGGDLFGNSPNLKTITIPSTVTFIDPYFNRFNESLETIILADGNKVYSYDESGALKSVYNTSGEYHLQNYPAAKKDKKVTIGEGIHRLEIGCFYNNPYIEEIVINPDVVQFCYWCFHGCENVKTLRFTRTTNIEWGFDLSDTMFGSASDNNKPKEVTVIVPKGTLAEYQALFERDKPDASVKFTIVEE